MSDEVAGERTTDDGRGVFLDDLVTGVADGLEEVSRVTPADAQGWEEHSRGASLFARVSRAVLEVRLPEDIAEASLRTPDTSEIPGRPGWVRFAPTSDERHVRDRAEAWYLTAWRHSPGPGNA
jgi:hypothetical protein